MRLTTTRVHEIVRAGRPGVSQLIATHRVVITKKGGLRCIPEEEAIEHENQMRDEQERAVA